MVFFEYIGDTQLFRLIEVGLNDLVQQPMAMILVAMIIGAAVFVLARRY